jgi:hypothetical protein
MYAADKQFIENATKVLSDSVDCSVANEKH